MQPWQYLLLALALALLALVLLIRRAWLRRKKRQERDFTRRLETLLQPRETVKAICPNRGGRWVLTSRRLLLENGEGFTAVAFGKIKGLSGVDKLGKTTVNVSKMTRLTIKTETEHTLYNTCPEFVALAKGLKSRTRKKPTAKTKG